MKWGITQRNNTRSASQCFENNYGSELDGNAPASSEFLIPHFKLHQYPVINAAQHAGMDAHQVAYLAEALYQDPLSLGVIHPKTDETITKRVQQHHMDLPKANNRNLALRLLEP